MKDRDLYNLFKKLVTVVTIYNNIKILNNKDLII